jgi:methanogenic corrinoid protein MtbC1
VTTIKHAAALLGVPEATLRAWERRYAVVSPTRNEAGYRVYDDAALRRLAAMAALVGAGWSPREAAERVKSQAPGRDAAPDSGPPSGSGFGDDDAGSPGASGSLGASGGAGSTGGAAAQTLVQVASTMDHAGLDAALDTAFALASFDQVVDAWLMPALREVGRAWREGRVDVAGEHLVSATVQRRLGAAMDAAGRAVSAPRVAVGLAEGSRHELGVLAFAVVLQRAGVDVSYLGADLPPENWADAVHRLEPDAVVLGVPMTHDVLAVQRTVATLAAAFPGLRIFLGGAAQDQVGGRSVPLGHSIRNAARDLAGILHAPPTPAREQAEEPGSIHQSDNRGGNHGSA